MNSQEQYWKLVESEQHFNTIQAGIRNRASTWILAAFAAIALLIQVSKEVTWLVPSAALIGLICLMATVGLLLLWINDQIVYQKLLGSVFMVGLKWEYDNPDMPPIRTMMMYASEGKGMSRWMTLYYTIPMAVFLAISILVTVLREQIGASSEALTSEHTLWILVAICLAQTGISLWVQYRRAKLGNQELAGNFGEDGFTAMFSGEDSALAQFRQVIHRHQSAVDDGQEKKQLPESATK